MFSTSSDVLNLVLAVCITVLTIFLVSALYYVVAGVRKIFRLVDKVETGVSKAEEVITLIKDKIKSGSAYFMILAEVAKQAIKIAKDNDWLKGKKTGTKGKGGKK